jgi:hypothetical protein
MTLPNELEKEVLTRLLHAGSGGLGKEVLDNYRGEEQVALCLQALQEKGWIQHSKEPLEFPIKLSAAGVEAAKTL